MYNDKSFLRFRETFVKLNNLKSYSVHQVIHGPFIEDVSGMNRLPAQIHFSNTSM